MWSPEPENCRNRNPHSSKIGKLLPVCLTDNRRRFVLVGCSLWTRKANTAADNGVFYAITSESECMAECLTSATCLAFDLTPFGCTLHNNADDLTTAYYAPGVTQFLLNRHCLPAGLITLIIALIIFLSVKLYFFL